MLKIEHHGEYRYDLQELLLETSVLSKEIDQRIKLFQNNPEDTRLDNHALTEKMAGKWAFSITSEIRIVYEWLSKTTVRFLAIGGHEKVYKQ